MFKTRNSYQEKPEMAIEKRIRKNGISFKIIAYAGYYIDDNGKSDNTKETK